MRNVSVARRYARALIELANETAELEVMQRQLQDLVQVVTANPELNDVATNPIYTREQRAGVMDSVLRSGAIHPMLANFVRLLVDRNRLGHLVDIARQFRDMADALAGRIRGKVVTAVPMGDEPLKNVKRSLARLTQREVILESEVEPALLGGMKALVGSVVYDGSLRSQLEALRRDLKEGK
jgi:F-type H+-transporting ATPase subunit delta